MRMLIPLVALVSNVFGNDQLKQLQAEYSRAVLQLKVAEVNLQQHEKVYERLTKLAKLGAVGKEQVAKAKAKFELARAHVQKAKAQVEQAKATLEKAKVNGGTIPLLKQKEGVLRELLTFAWPSTHITTSVQPSERMIATGFDRSGDR